MKVLLPTLRQLRPALPTLTSDQFTALLVHVLKRSSKADQHKEVSVLEQLQAYLYEWLWHLNFLSDSQVRLILNRCDGQLRVLTGYVASMVPRDIRLPVHMLTISDSKYVSWPGSIWLNLTTEEDNATLPAPAVTHISCDLSALFLRKQAWLTSRNDSGAADK